jgi:transcriptional regulator with XRE-family HTH domain
MPESVGQLLRSWRQSRGLSQLEVAMHAGFSARHISFIETGKAEPSRDAVLAIAESLEVPLRERNRLLAAGGFADLYRETQLAAADMAHVRQVLQFILDRHMPYGAMVLDRLSTCLMGNAASAQLLSALADPSLLMPNANMLRVIFHPHGVRRFIVNWPEVSRVLLDRAERELATAHDPAATELLREIRGYAADLPKPQPRRLQSSDLLLPVEIRTDAFELRVFSTIMTIGTPRDITLQELRIETFFPADDTSEQTWRRIAASPPAG